jgi:predicted amidophosphoribosyltransferase
MKWISSFLAPAIHMLYPQHCPGCGADMPVTSALLCVHCLHELPRTGFAGLQNNTTEAIFFGRLQLKAAHSEYYFSKGQLIQGLMHQLKYKNKPEVGIFLGNLLGESLLISSRFSQLDLIMPMPMHKSKEYKETVKLLKAERKRRSTFPSLKQSSIEIHYVRYADDWMLGIKGKREIAVKLKEEIAIFLKSTF